MSDVERVFALYVQANPVPEPDLLDPTRDETELPIIEGSPDMNQSPTELKDRVRVRQPEPFRRWNPAAALAGAFVVVLAIVGAVFLLRGEAGPVAAADAHPVITCDGESCSYEGPTSVFEGEVEITFVNDGPRFMQLGVWAMGASELAAELERTPVDTDRALDPDDPVPLGDLALVLDGFPGQEVTNTLLLTAPQTHLIDCLTTTMDETGGFAYNDHLWRVAEIEVIEP